MFDPDVASKHYLSHELVANRLYEAFFDAICGPRGARTFDVDTPMKGLTLEFRKSLRPDQPFDMGVELVAIGVHTYRLRVTGRDLAGQILFVGELTPITVDGERRAIPLPDRLRGLLAAYPGAPRPEADSRETG